MSTVCDAHTFLLTHLFVVAMLKKTLLFALPSILAFLGLSPAFTSESDPAAQASDVTPLQQLFVAKEIKPDLERIGIIWKAGDNRDELMDKIKRAGASTGIKVFLAEADDMKDVAPRFRELTRDRKVQMIWVVQDDDLLTQDMIQSFLVKSATEALVPLLVPNSAWVDAGGTVALERADGSIKLVVNKKAIDAMALTVPAKYQEGVTYLAAN
ncbi:MAG: ABC transporter substrate binding protein [Rhodothermales bacterium]